MRQDSRLSVALHVLLHMSEMDQAVSSETLGSMVDANPVVLRRTMAGLRDAGILRSDKGHGGGWSIARDLGSVTLADVYEALGTTHLFGIGHRDPSPRCPIEKAVNRAVGAALDDAEALFVTRLRSVAVADLLGEARRRLASRRGKGRNVHA